MVHVSIGAARRIVLKRDVHKPPVRRKPGRSVTEWLKTLICWARQALVLVQLVLQLLNL